jgi:hypothetical protein
MEMFANPALVVVFGVIAPFVISLAKNPAWPPWAKQLLTLGVALAFGVLDQALRVEAEGASWSVAEVVERAAVVAVLAQALYWFLLEGSASPAGRLNAMLEGVGSRGLIRGAGRGAALPPIHDGDYVEREHGGTGRRLVQVGEQVVDGHTITEFRSRRPGEVIGSDSDPPVGPV